MSNTMTNPSSSTHYTPRWYPTLFFFSTLRPPPTSTLFPYTTLFRSRQSHAKGDAAMSSNAANFPLMVCVKLAALLRSEEHTSELQSLTNLVCRLLLEKKKRPVPAHLDVSHRAPVRGEMLQNHGRDIH